MNTLQATAVKARAFTAAYRAETDAMNDTRVKYDAWIQASRNGEPNALDLKKAWHDAADRLMECRSVKFQTMLEYESAKEKLNAEIGLQLL